MTDGKGHSIVCEAHHVPNCNAVCCQNDKKSPSDRGDGFSSGDTVKVPLFLPSGVDEETFRKMFRKSRS